VPESQPDTQNLKANPAASMSQVRLGYERDKHDA
jgi:hypothetical protein